MHETVTIDGFTVDDREWTPAELLAYEEGYLDVITEKAAALRCEAEELDFEAYAYAHILHDELCAHCTQAAANIAAEVRQSADEIVSQRKNVERARREVVLASLRPSLTHTTIRCASRFSGTRSRERRTIRCSRTSRGSPSRPADDDPDPVALQHPGRAA